MLYTILIIEDDNDLRQFIKKTLEDKAFSVREAEDGLRGLKYLENHRPDLVLLDLGLPKMQGESLCREIKELYPDLPIIILTGKNTTQDIVNGLNLGADDYITKPFEMNELTARIKARLRVNNQNESKMKVADLELDTKSLEVTRGKQKIKLTPQEFKLLKYLMENRDRVLSRDIILDRVWFYSPDANTRVVDVYIGYLRKKIDSKAPKKLIHSVRGFGYTIKE